LSKQRRLGRGLEALLGRGPSLGRPQIHDPEDDFASDDDRETVTPIMVNQSHGGGLVPRRVDSVEPTDADVSPETAWPTDDSSGDDDGESGNADEPSFAHVFDGPTVPGDSPSNVGTFPDGTATLLHVDIHLIETNPFQPRKDFSPEELAQLSQSIEEHGLLQPLLVRRVDEAYQLIAGERRLRAAQAAGWREVPVKVVEAGDRQMTELALVENLQRKDLNAMEKAASFKQYLQSVGCTQEELAKRLKLDRSTIANLIRLLELPEPVQAAVRVGKITQGHARALLPLGDEARQIEFARRVEREGLSVRAIEHLVQETIDQEDREPLSVAGRVGGTTSPRPQSEQTSALEQEFRAGLGMKVKLTHSARGRGKLVIHFANHDEFDRLRQHILGVQQTAKERVG